MMIRYSKYMYSSSYRPISPLTKMFMNVKVISRQQYTCSRIQNRANKRCDQTALDHTIDSDGMSALL